MFLPLSDRPNHSDVRPWVNYGLIAINLLVFFLVTPRGELERTAFNFEWGYVPGAPRLVTHFTSMFMHAGFMHLAGNMLFLWIFGDNVEGRLGHVGYLFAYLTFGLAAVLLYQLLDPDSMFPLVGASGAIYGTLGFYWIAFRDNRVRVLIWFFLIFFHEFNARVVLGFYFVLDFANMVLAKSAQVAGQTQEGGIAYAAHVGGFAFGLGLAFVVGRLAPARRRVGTRRGVDRRAGRRGPFAADQLDLEAGMMRMRRGTDAARAGRYEDAYADFEWIVRRFPETSMSGHAALHMAMIRGRVIGDFAGARGLLQYAIRTIDDPRLRARAQAELSELS